MSGNLIISDPSVMMGKPVITGTRITVEIVLEKLAAGETVEQIMEAPSQTDERGGQSSAGIRCRSLAGRCRISYRRPNLMNFLADEGVDFPVVQKLRSEGHEMLYVAEMDPGISVRRYWRSPMTKMLCC
jgi:hypothetical protein